MNPVSFMNYRVTDKLQVEVDSMLHKAYDTALKILKDHKQFRRSVARLARHPTGMIVPRQPVLHKNSIFSVEDRAGPHRDRMQFSHGERRDRLYTP